MNAEDYQLIRRSPARQWLLISATMVILSGCVALAYTLDPVPVPTLWETGARPNHVVLPVAPRIVTQTERLGLYRHTEWLGVAAFESTIICPFGLPALGERASCLQWYGGIKADGTESLLLQKVRGVQWWDYTFTPEEQSAFRWHEVGYPNPYDMGGS